MSTKEILNYFVQTADRPIRDDLRFAVMHTADSPIGPKVAIDCGCGAGADIAYLREQSFRVFAFDIERDAVNLCLARFRGDELVEVSQASFNSFSYPSACLIVADASLFFCPSQDFEEVWRKICKALSGGGVFCGSFLGPRDTMASATYNASAYWPDVLVFEKDDLLARFVDFEVLRFTEHEQSGFNVNGEPHDWHIYSLVARKR